MAKEPLVVAGMAVAAAVFTRVDRQTRFVARRRGRQRSCDKGEIVAVVEGRTRALLSAERTALNFLQRLSGVATLTRRFVDAVAGTRARIVDTRKTDAGLARARQGGGARRRRRQPSRRSGGRRAHQGQPRRRVRRRQGRRRAGARAGAALAARRGRGHRAGADRRGARGRRRRHPPRQLRSADGGARR